MEITRLKKTLRRKIFFAKYIYIIGHNDLDLDAFGAMVGINLLVKKFLKKSSIIMETTNLELGVSKALAKVKNQLNIINSKDVRNFDNSLLIVVDTNKKYLLSCQEDLDKFSEIIVIDHHDIDNDTIKNKLNFIYNNISSTCEIVSELIKAFGIKIDYMTATLLLSGIVLDTNNFILRTDKNTFFNAYYLSKKGASPIEVQYLLKQDLKKFVNREKMLTNVRIVDKKIAIAKGVKEELYRREDLAKVSETLLLFNNIETSFVIGNLSQTEIGISTRTLGKTNVGKLMNNFGGGGSINEAAAKLTSLSINEVEDELLKLLAK